MENDSSNAKGPDFSAAPPYGKPVEVGHLPEGLKHELPASETLDEATLASNALPPMEDVDLEELQRQLAALSGN